MLKEREEVYIFFVNGNSFTRHEPDAAADCEEEISEGLTKCLWETAEDITMMRGMGFDINDDNEPAPENIPVKNGVIGKATFDSLFEGQTWGWDGLCDRRRNGFTNINSTLKIFDTMF